MASLVGWNSALWEGFLYHCLSEPFLRCSLKTIIYFHLQSGAQTIRSWIKLCCFFHPVINGEPSQKAEEELLRQQLQVTWESRPLVLIGYLCSLNYNKTPNGVRPLLLQCVASGLSQFHNLMGQDDHFSVICDVSKLPILISAQVSSIYR